MESQYVCRPGWNVLPGGGLGVVVYDLSESKTTLNPINQSINPGSGYEPTDPVGVGSPGSSHEPACSSSGQLSSRVFY